MSTVIRVDVTRNAASWLAEIGSVPEGVSLLPEMPPNADGSLRRDRRIQVFTDCGHSFEVGVPLDAPVPYQVGDPTTFHCCVERIELERVVNPRNTKPGGYYTRVKEGEIGKDTRVRISKRVKITHQAELEL